MNNERRHTELGALPRLCLFFGPKRAWTMGVMKDDLLFQIHLNLEMLQELRQKCKISYKPFSSSGDSLIGNVTIKRSFPSGPQPSRVAVTRLVDRRPLHQKLKNIGGYPIPTEVERPELGPWSVVHMGWATRRAVKNLSW